MADFNAIAVAIAVRFAAAAITPPSGEQDIRVSTSALPQSIVLEPTVLTFPPDVEFSYTAATRTGIAVFPVRFYLYRVRDNARNATLLLKWLGALYDQLSGQVHLGLDTYVSHAVVRNMAVGVLTYAAEEFEGITG